MTYRRHNTSAHAVTRQRNIANSNPHNALRRIPERTQSVFRAPHATIRQEKKEVGMLTILSADMLPVPPDQRDAFEAIRKQLLRDTQPVNQVQAGFTNSLIRATWQVHRCDLAEKQLGEELGVDPLLSSDKRLGQIQRTRTQAEREIRLALKELKKLQTDHAIRRLEPYRGLLEMPVPIEATKLVAAARQAGGTKKHETITFAPTAKKMNEAAKKQGHASAWEAWLKHQGPPGETENAAAA
jgi:hypothetical protein